MATEVRMLRLSDTMENATVVSWLKQEGDTVSEGDPLLEVETDKANVEITASVSGTLLKIVAPEGTIVEVGELLALIGDPVEPIPELEPARPEDAETAPPRLPVTEPIPSRRVKAAPKARRLAQELGLSLEQIEGTGPGGLITEGDVRRFQEAQARKAPAQADLAAEEELIPLTALRRQIAERVSLSRRTMADVTTVAEVDMSAAVELRRTTSATYTAIVVKAVAMALRQFPIVNSTFSEKGIVLKKQINIGVAVAIEDGLVVPVIRQADAKSLGEINQELDAVASRARAGELTPGDMAGGTFTVTNSGVFGSLLFTPIINYPQSATLGMGKVMDTPIARDGQVVIRPMMFLCLSYDHRVMDGAVAVRFLQQVKEHLEQAYAPA